MSRDFFCAYSEFVPHPCIRKYLLTPQSICCSEDPSSIHEPGVLIMEYDPSRIMKKYMQLYTSYFSTVHLDMPRAGCQRRVVQTFPLLVQSAVVPQEKGSLEVAIPSQAKLMLWADVAQTTMFSNFLECTTPILQHPGGISRAIYHRPPSDPNPTTSPV